MRELAREKFTDAWREARRARITSSKLSLALARAGSLARDRYIDELLLDLQGVPDHADESESRWMLDARFEHQQAREWYAKTKSVEVTNAGFVIHDDYPWLGFSPAGFIGDDGLLHVKHRKKLATLKQHWICKGAELKRVQFELLISGRKWCDFVNYFATDTREKGTVQRVFPHPQMMCLIEYGAHVFWHDVLTKYRMEMQSCED